jgi:cobalt-zinc-cadmium efflux system outer membrane protein
LFAFSDLLRRRCAVAPALVGVLVALAPAAVAQNSPHTSAHASDPAGTAGPLNTPGTPGTPISLRAALEAAWALHPASRAAGNRWAELEARALAAQTFTPGSPTVGWAHRTDALSSNAGLREYEAEVAVPLWNPGVRGATQHQVAADRGALEWQLRSERLRLAGEVRDAAAQVAWARAECEGAARKHLEASALAQDVERRVKAGETARVDALQAHASVQLAQGQLAQHDAALVRALGQWRALTGQTQEANLDEPLPDAAAQTPATIVQNEHPALQTAMAQIQSARARLALTEADRRDPMELGLGVTRERAAAGASPETSVRFAVRIPLGGDSRNAARRSAALAELDAAQAQADAIARQTQADVAAARAGLDAARSQETFATQRATLSTQMQALVAKSYRLGESDLPTRMRADNEKLDADLALARARIELQRAVAQLNQSLGTLP